MLLSPTQTSENSLLAAEILSVAFVLYCLACAVYNRYFHPYKDFPGPFWASITPLWYFRAVRWARGQDHQLPLHKRYGPFVRVAPDQIQIMDPAAIETIVMSISQIKRHLLTMTVRTQERLHQGRLLRGLQPQDLRAPWQFRGSQRTPSHTAQTDRGSLVYSGLNPRV